MTTKEDRGSRDVEGAAYFERFRARDAGEDYHDRPTLADVEPSPFCQECGEELTEDGHCGYCDGDNE